MSDPKSTNNRPQSCPDTTECNTYDQAESHGNSTNDDDLDENTKIKLVFKLVFVFAVALIVVFGAYLKLRPSFSSYIFAIPFHLFAGLLLLFVSIMAIYYYLLLWRIYQIILYSE